MSVALYIYKFFYKNVCSITIKIYEEITSA